MRLLTFRSIMAEIKNFDPFQELQLNSIKTILPELLAIYCNPEENLSELKRYVNDAYIYYLGRSNDPFFCKVVLPLLIINRYFIASSGPRVGGILEKIILKLLEEKYEEASSNVNIYDYSLFAPFAKNYRGRKVIDFIARKNDELYLVEMRASEHTGGRTGQESLLDKFKVVLDWIIEDYKPFIDRNIKEINLVITILYGEKTYKLLTRNEITGGRLNSLIKYIIEELGPKFEGLIKRGFRSNVEMYEEELRKGEKLTFISSSGFQVSLSILTGQEFFERILSLKYEDLDSKFSNLGDDLWIVIGMMPYELRYYYQHGYMWSKKIYELITDNNSPIYIQRLIKKYKVETDIEDKIIDEISDYVMKNEKKLTLLESNDLHLQYDYLRKLIAISLLLYTYKCPKRLSLK